MESEAKDISTMCEIKSCYIGVDLHKDQITWHQIYRLSDGQTERTTGRISTARIQEDFIPMLSKENSYVIVEASCSTFFFYSMIESYCRKAYVINPGSFRELYMTGKKTDRIDAKKLADRLMYHVEMNDKDDGFPEVYIPDNEILQIRKLVTTYELLVKQATQLKNQLKAVFRAKLIPVAVNIMEEGLEEAEANPALDEADRMIIETIKNLHDSLEKKKDEIRRKIVTTGLNRFRKEIEQLTQISGISVIGATVFMSDICTVKRFASAKKMTSYLSSTGKVDSSGKTTINGGLNKRGRRTSYRFILQGLQHIVNGNIHLMKFTERHTAKKGNKVRAAVVRKTFVIMYYMLRDGTQYRYFNETVYNRKMHELKKLEKNEKVA